MEEQSETAAPPKRKRTFFTRKRALYALIFLAVLGTALIFILPFAVREGIEYALRSQGHEDPFVDEVYLNPFTATLTVRGLTGGDELEDFIEAGHVHFVLDWLALFQRNVRVKTAIIEDVRVYVRQDESLIWRVGSVDARELPTEWKSFEVLNLPVGVGVESVALRNIEIVFQNWDVHAIAVVEEGGITGLRTWTQDNPAPFDVTMTVNEAPVRITGTTTPFNNTAAISLAVAIEALPMDALATMAAGFGVTEVGGSLDGDFEAEAFFHLADQTVDATVTGQFELAAISAAYDTYHTQSDGVSWDGTVKLAGGLSSQTISTDGALTVTNAAFREDTEGITGRSGEASWRGTTELQTGDALSLAASGTLDGEAFEVGGVKDAFAEATVGGLSAAVEQFRFTSGETATIALAAVRGGATDVAVNELNGAQGRITLAEAGLDAADVAAELGPNGTTVTASLTGTARDFAAIDLSPDLRDAGLGEGEVILTGLRVESKESATRIDTQAELRAANLKAALVEWPASGQIDEMRGSITLAATAPADGELEFTVEGLAESAGVTVLNTDSGLAVLRVARGTVDGVTAAGLRDIKLAAASFEQPRLLQRSESGGDAPDAYVATFGTVNVSNVALGDVRATAENIVVDGLQSYIVITEVGDIEPLALVGAFLPEEADPSAPANEPAADPKIALASTARAPDSAPANAAADFSLRASLIELKGDTLIKVEDRSVSPAASIEVHELIARLQDLDTESPDALVPINMEATLGESSRLRVAGEAAPLAGEPSANLEAQIQSINLMDLTGYSQRNIGYQIDSGMFSADCDIKIDRGQLLTQNQLMINRLMLTKLKEDELTELDNQLGMPVNAAVNLLRDGNGDIELSVPVEGDLNNPEIKIGDVMRKAISGAMKKSVMAVFAPLRIFGKGKDNDDVPLDEALDFKDVTFPAASTDYDPDSTEYLDEIAKIMKQYPGVSLRLRGVANQADRDLLAAQTTTDAGTSTVPASRTHGPVLVPAGEADKYAPPPAEEAADTAAEPAIADDALMRLADERAQAVKTYLVDGAGIDATRLFVTASTIDDTTDESAGPRVEIAL